MNTAKEVAARVAVSSAIASWPEQRPKPGWGVEGFKGQSRRKGKRWMSAIAQPVRYWTRAPGHLVPWSPPDYHEDERSDDERVVSRCITRPSSAE